MAAVVIGFFVSLVAAAFLWVLLDQAMVPLLDMAAENASLSAASKGVSDAREGWQQAVWFVLVLLAVMGLAGAAAVSRRPTR